MRPFFLCVPATEDPLWYEYDEIRVATIPWGLGGMYSHYFSGTHTNGRIPSVRVSSCQDLQVSRVAPSKGEEPEHLNGASIGKGGLAEQ